MTMQAYFAGRSWSGRRKARCAGVAVLDAVGAFVFLLCAIAVMFELDAISRPTGGALDSTFVGLLALGALLPSPFRCLSGASPLVGSAELRRARAAHLRGMSTHQPSQHPRVGDGQFTTKARTEPA